MKQNELHEIIVYVLRRLQGFEEIWVAEGTYWQEDLGSAGKFEWNFESFGEGFPQSVWIKRFSVPPAYCVKRFTGLHKLPRVTLLSLEPVAKPHKISSVRNLKLLLTISSSIFKHKAVIIKRCWRRCPITSNFNADLKSLLTKIFRHKRMSIATGFHCLLQL